ncbi:MAG TPA: pyridoxamine 5'-phosphate oxidase family protein [Patescibacteria group bacterium]|jgi:uncharacterized protein YhbP (UPF0306 family)|nr:pyridoxamine 5'-phosphate oxidase family protein [Patescibacteria group bacterium]
MEIDIEKAIREYLPQIVHMSLGTSKNNKPWVCEVHFVYDDNLNLYFRSLASRRHSQEIAENPSVAGNIVRQHALGEYPMGVYFEGKAAMMQPGDDQNKVAALIKNNLKHPDDILADAMRDDGHKLYKITVANWYVFGKLDGQKAQKHLLEWNGGKK